PASCGGFIDTPARGGVLYYNVLRTATGECDRPCEWYGLGGRVRHGQASGCGGSVIVHGVAGGRNDLVSPALRGCRRSSPGGAGCGWSDRGLVWWGLSD